MSAPKHSETSVGAPGAEKVSPKTSSAPTVSGADPANPDRTPASLQRTGGKRPANSPVEKAGKKADDKDTPPAKASTAPAKDGTLPHQDEEVVFLDDPDIDTLGDVEEMKDALEELATTQPQSYASKAKKGQVFYPNLLSIHTGSEERRFISNETFQAYVKALEGEIVKAIMDGENIFIRCGFKRWSNGRGLMGCVDKATADWIKSATNRIKVGGNDLKAWSRGEFGSMARMSFYVDSSCGCDVSNIMPMLQKQNKLPGNFVVHASNVVTTVDRKTKASKRGFNFQVGVCKELKEAVISLNCELYLLLTRVSVTFPDRKRKQSEVAPSAKRSSPSIPSAEELAEMDQATRKKKLRQIKKAGLIPPEGLEGLLMTKSKKLSAKSKVTVVAEASGSALETEVTKAPAEDATATDQSTSKAAAAAPKPSKAEDKTKPKLQKQLSGEEFRKKQLEGKQKANLAKREASASKAKGKGARPRRNPKPGSGTPSSVKNTMEKFVVVLKPSAK